MVKHLSSTLKALDLIPTITKRKMRKKRTIVSPLDFACDLPIYGILLNLPHPISSPYISSPAWLTPHSLVRLWTKPHFFLQKSLSERLPIVPLIMPYSLAYAIFPKSPQVPQDQGLLSPGRERQSMKNKAERQNNVN